MLKRFLLPLLFFSTLSYAQTEVFFVFHPDCIHCKEVHPYFREISKEFENTSLVFAELDVSTEEGLNTASILGWSWGTGTPAVYIDSDLEVRGARPDFKAFLTSKICEKIDFDHPSCSGVINPEIFYFTAVAVALLVGGLIVLGFRKK